MDGAHNTIDILGIFTAFAAGIAALAALVGLTWQILSRRPRIIARMRYTGIYGEHEIEKDEIRVNVRNLKQRNIKVFGVGFMLSNGNFYYPNGWDVPKILSHETDIDYIVDIGDLEEGIRNNEPGSKIKSAYLEESEEAHIHDIKIPQKIRRRFDKFNTQD